MRPDGSGTLGHRRHGRVIRQRPEPVVADNRVGQPCGRRDGQRLPVPERPVATAGPPPLRPGRHADDPGGDLRPAPEGHERHPARVARDEVARAVDPIQVPAPLRLARRPELLAAHGVVGAALGDPLAQRPLTASSTSVTGEPSGFIVTVNRRSSKRGSAISAAMSASSSASSRSGFMAVQCEGSVRPSDRRPVPAQAPTVA